jgi:hypothetical protein
MNLSDNCMLIAIITCSILFFFIVLPIIDKQNMEEEIMLREDFENMNKLVKIDENKCSPNCCKHVQWPVPFNTITPGEENKYKDYIGSNLTCNLGNNTGGGCVCVKKSDYEYLGRRGQDF